MDRHNTRKLRPKPVSPVKRQAKVQNKILAIYCAQSLSCVSLFATSWTIGWTGRIFKAGILEWAAISYSGDLPNPGIKPVSLASPVLAGRLFTTAPRGLPQQFNSSILKSMMNHNQDNFIL